MSRAAVLESFKRAELERYQNEKDYCGLTIGFKIETKETIIEAPLEKDSQGYGGFLILNNLMLFEDGTLTYVRKTFEIISGKKIRQIMGQRYLIQQLSPNVAIKP